MSKARVPSTLQEAIVYFADYQNCKEFMVMLRWPEGKVQCPTCGSEKVTYLEKARVFKCYGKHEKPKFSLKTGTIFEDSPIGLEKWLPVVWMIVNAKNGISSWEIHRAMGVTQKTAWFMLQRARLAMQDDKSGGMLGGQIEIDETFVGGKARNMHKDRKERAQAGGDRNTGWKAVVFGMLERDGRVRAAVLPDRKNATIRPVVREHVEKGAEIFSDEHGHLWKMDEYTHNVINHLEHYVQGNVHTNGIENFWSLLKRGLGGTYVSVEPFHLFRYVDEQAFRFNYRKLTDADRFVIAMSQVTDRRLTYAELIGKQESEQGPSQDTSEVPF